MKRIILALWLVSSSVCAGDLTANDLLTICTSKESGMQRLCGVYMLGAVQGIEIGQSLAIGPNKKVYAQLGKGVLCIPDDMSTLQISRVFVDLASAMKSIYPSDLDAPAIGIVSAAFIRKFSCGASGK
ncbi:MAG: hypothetical protein H7240_09110 [Glaciimonas sp.]|nr:hypothetical protein [Glaciimonas sp.]